MLCQNCSKSIDPGARFCGFCGMEQRVGTPPQAAFGETLPGLATPDDVSAASDVTVILPRRRANAFSADTAHPKRPLQSASAPSNGTFDKSATHRSRVPAMKIGAAVVIVMMAVFVAVVFHANRPATPAAKEVATPAIAMQPMPASAPRPLQSDEPDDRVPSSGPSTVVPRDAALVVEEAPLADARSASDVTPQADLPTQRTAAPPNQAQRKKSRTPASRVTEPAPAESPLPQPVVASPAPAPATPSPPVEPVKVERVACADNANPFARELCLWQECAKPDYRSHAECARFTGSGAQR